MNNFSKDMSRERAIKRLVNQVLIALITIMMIVTVWTMKNIEVKIDVINAELESVLQNKDVID